MASSNKKTSFSVGIIILFIPFLFFYWMIPFVSGMTIGNDYLAFPIKQQMELLFSIKAGSFPLYMPGFASGHSSSALTLGAVFHPLPHIASMMPGYWNGKAIDWNNFFKLFSLGFTQLALFAFLRKIKLNILFSFLFSLITVYNLRTIDLFHYGAPIEAFTAHLLLCSAIGWYFINRTKCAGPLCIISATYLLVCSGHPQMMYYGLLGAGLFALVIPFFLSDIFSDEKLDYKISLGFYLRVGIFLFLGIILSSGYIIPFYFDFISVNIDRMSQDYVWANENLDTFLGTVNNFLLPLRSEAHSAFGGSSLILVAAIVPVLSFFKIKVPRSIWYIWSLLLIISLYMLGNGTPFHKLVWEYLPFASSSRTPGRLSMIMPIFMMMILAWIVKKEMCIAKCGLSSFKFSPLRILSCTALLLLAIYYGMYIAGYHIFSIAVFLELFPPYPVGNFLNISFSRVELIMTICGIASLIFLAMYRVRTGKVRAVGVLLIMMIFIQVGIGLKYRSAFWIEKKYDSPTFEEIKKQKNVSLDYLFYPGGGMHSSIVIKQLERSFVEPFLGKIFTEVIPVEDMSEAYIKMERERLPQQVFIEGYSLQKAKAITEGAKDITEGAVKLIYSSFNRLKFKVNSQSIAFFGLSYPYTGNWSAWVNGETVRVYRSNGAAHAVEIPAGESQIEFRYWSDAFFWGIVISCAVFAIIGFFVCIRALKGFPKIAGVVVVLCISAGGFMLWYNSLYRGDNLGTNYTWNYKSPSTSTNLAYGKKNWLSPSVAASDFAHARWHIRQLNLYVGRFVDGNRRQGSGFSTQLSDNPGWFLDLSRMEDIEKILLFEDSLATLINTRPLTVALSDDGSNWRTITSVVSPVSRYGPTQVVLKNPSKARYIKIWAHGKTKLSFDEVEVYGP